MAGEHCCGRLVGLFDPSQCAPGEASLAGCAIGYRGRSRACHCDESGGLSIVRLMDEDFRASTGLEDQSLCLCGPCADAYDARVGVCGCAKCGAALRQEIRVPDQLRHEAIAADLSTLCAACAFESMAAIAQAALDMATRHAHVMPTACRLGTRPRQTRINPHEQSSKYDSLCDQIGSEFRAGIVERFGACR